MQLTLSARQALAEFLGSAGLVTVVIGSGIGAQELSSGDAGLQLLENALITGAGLVALILAFGPVSGGHFNPVVTVTDWVFGGSTGRQIAVYLPAQVLGGIVGALIANLMNGLPAVNVSTDQRGSAGLYLSEALATFGLVLLIFGLVRAGRVSLAPFAVGAYITAAYWWSSSTSFANPMVTISRTLSDTFAGIAPASVPAYVAFQLIGAAIAIPVVALLYPHVANDHHELLVPHEQPPRRDPSSPVATHSGESPL